MRLAIALGLIGIGVVLLVMGINSSDSVANEISDAFRGTPTDRTVWFLLGGAASVLAGIGMAIVPAKVWTRA